MIDVMVDIDAGSRWDPSGLEGLASLVAGMLLKGHHSDGELYLRKKLASFLFKTQLYVLSVQVGIKSLFLFVS